MVFYVTTTFAHLGSRSGDRTLDREFGTGTSHRLQQAFLIIRCPIRKKFVVKHRYHFQLSQSFIDGNMGETQSYL